MGRNKAVLPWGDVTIIEAVVRTARCVSSECVLLGRDDALPASLADLEQLPDARLNAGPMGGLASLLKRFPDRWCLLMGCDMPEVTVPVIGALTPHTTGDARIVVYGSDDGLEPCCALYHSAILRDVEVRLLEARRSLSGLIRSLPHVRVGMDAVAQRALRNVNCPGDYDPPV